MADYVGSKVRIEADNGSFEGIIQALDQNSRRITLNKVVSCKSGKKMPGQQYFYGNELDKITILEEKRKEVKDLMADDPHGPKLLRTGRKLNTEHLSRIRDLDYDALCLSRRNVYDDDEKSLVQNVRKSIPVKDLSASSSCPLPPPETKRSGHRGTPRPEYFIFIDSINEDFQTAMTYLSKESIVGMAAEGVSIGRNGELCLLQLATQSHVFIFDMLVLGAVAFKDGLAELIQCPRVLKVVHDSRLVSDMLFHKFGVNLINIFDTQVADVIAYKIYHNGDLPRYVSGLPLCLFQYLELNPEEVFISRVRQHQKEEDESVWTVRPLPMRLFDCATKNVIYLRELRTALMDHLMAEFTTGVDIYLSVIRDLDQEEICKEKYASHKLPLNFKGLGRMLRVKGDDFDFVGDDGFTENCRGVADPWVVFSKGGMFQRHPQSTTANTNPHGKVLFHQGSFTSPGVPSAPITKGDMSGVESGSHSEGETDKSELQKRKQRINFKDCASPTTPKKSYRSPDGHGQISSIRNAKLSPHQSLETTHLTTEEEEKEKPFVSPDVTEFTQLAKRLATLSTSIGKGTPADVSLSGGMPRSYLMSSEPANTPSLSAKATPSKQIKQEGPTLTPNQDPTSTGLNYSFHPAGEMEVPKKKSRGLILQSGYDTDSGVSESENLLPSGHRNQTRASNLHVYSTEDYGAIPETSDDQSKRSLLSSQGQGQEDSNHDETNAVNDSLEAADSSGQLEAASFVSHLQQMVGLKKDLPKIPGLGHSGMDLPSLGAGAEQSHLENKGRGYMLRPY